MTNQENLIVLNFNKIGYCVYLLQHCLLIQWLNALLAPSSWAAGQCPRLYFIYWLVIGMCEDKKVIVAANPQATENGIRSIFKKPLLRQDHLKSTRRNSRALYMIFMQTQTLSCFSSSIIFWSPVLGYSLTINPLFKYSATLNRGPTSGKWMHP